MQMNLIYKTEIEADVENKHTDPKVGKRGVE